MADTNEVGINEIPDAVLPFKADRGNRVIKVSLNDVAYILVTGMAKAEERPVSQWLSRFLVVAINNHFREEIARLRKEREAKEQQ